MRGIVREFIKVFRVTAVSATLAFAGAFAVAYPDQALEAIRVVGEDARSSHPRGLIVLFLSALFCGLMAWYWARTLVRALLPYVNPAATDPNEKVGAFFKRNFPRLCGVLPFFGVAIGFLRAASTTQDSSASTLLRISAIVAGLLVILLYLFFVFRRRLMHEKTYVWKPILPSGESSPLRIRDLSKETTFLVVATSIFWFAAFMLTAFTYGQGMESLGPLGVLLVSLGTWIPAISILLYWGRVWRFPTVTALLAAGSLFSCLNLNDNHAIRHEIVANRADLPIDFDKAFTGWLENRADRASYDEYPVFFVAAEGGGLRAAYFTSLVLSAIQDRCPAFAQHLFAISSVSGGSVGASVFAAEAAKQAHNLPAAGCDSALVTPGAFQRMADSVLARDFLTPLFASGLYTDMLQRFVFFKIPVFDRARALETGLEESWHYVTGGDHFSKPFYQLWPNFTQSATPALFLNTTRVETGERMVVSNLYPLDSRFNHLISLADLDRRMDVRLSTAAALSARFPVVTPVGGIHAGDSIYRYADGGYFDNSGITTLAEMLSALRVGEPSSMSSHFRPIIIRLGFDVAPTDTRKGKRKDASTEARSGTTSQGFNELMSPVRTLLNSRGAREVNTVRRLRTAVNTFRENGAHVDLIEFQLLQKHVPLILGWLMSVSARREMTQQFGPPRACPASDQIENDCSFGRIVDALTPHH